MKNLLTAFLLLASTATQAQNFLSWQFSDRYFSFSLGTGTSTYFGELNANNTISDDPSQISLGIEARLLNRIGARIEGSYFTLKGNDANAPDSSFQRQRNLSFQSKNLHGQLHIIYYLKPYQGDYYKRWTFDPYLFGGVGYMRFEPTTELGSERYSLREAQTEGVEYKKWVTTIPAGVGGKFKINEFLNVNIEASYHFAFTDYLDDVSNTYATEFSSTTARLLSDRKDEIGVTNPDFYDQIQPGASRGNPNNNDSFLQLSVKAEIFLPSDLFTGKNKAIIKKPSAY
ncbi:hypothetical protein SAMN05421640_1442 [Ekhidna lutea]|uniref:DUF6089 domain-containing protein n=1 Tax=Ekhidna lutea TaxID=447679 RepID=A0A239HQN7_EKHLU|nr:DUF6089 family protein [Ekhidna lutea]SNS83521.1 hypothetical protein SAMN05421640_1442 [Ekhidna lutea]